MRKKAGESAPVTGSPKRPWTRVSEAEKSRIVTSILNKETTLRMAAKKYDINRCTITKWVNNAKVAELFDSQKAIEKKALKKDYVLQSTRAQEERNELVRDQ